MEITLDIPGYNPTHGYVFHWENNFSITVKSSGTAVQLSANKEGLVSLAKQLLCLAQDEVPAGVHLHYDIYNSLEDGSCEMIIEKTA